MTVIAYTAEDDVLDARLPDCGHRERAELHRDRFYLDRPGQSDRQQNGFYKRRRFAFCIEGHYVYLKRNPHRIHNHDTGYHWVHWHDTRACDGTVPVSPSEGQEHKLLKSRVTSAFRRAGCSPVREEVRSTTRKYVSDIVFWRPDDTRFAAEIQISGMTEGRARYRTNAAKDDGLEAVIWMTTRREEGWQRVVPCVGLYRPDRGDTRERIETVELFVTGTVVPTWQYCRTPRQCWRRQLHNEQDCPGHLEFRSLADEDAAAPMLGIDTFAERITTGELVVVDAPREKRAGTHPVISTPVGREEAREYAAELAEYRDLRRDEPELAPAVPYCTQPDRAPDLDEEATDPSAEAWSNDGLYAHMVNRARRLAREYDTYVRLILDSERFVEQRGLPGTTLLSYEILLVPTPEDRDWLLAHHYPAGATMAALAYDLRASTAS